MNGYAERLIRTLKEEEVDINDYQSITEARDRIGHFITQVYHQKRPHSALGYLTPTLRNCGLNKQLQRAMNRTTTNGFAVVLFITRSDLIKYLNFISA